MRFARLLGISSGFILLSMAGCGGGEGGYTPKTYDLDAIQSTFSEIKSSFKLTAFDGVNTYEMDITRTPGPASQVGSTPTKTILVTSLLYEDGRLIGDLSEYQYFIVDRFKFLAFYDQVSGHPTVFDQQYNLPHHALINQSGPLDSATIYTDNSFATPFGTYKDTWSLVPRGSGVNFCLDAEGSTTNGALSEIDCAILDDTGNVVGLTITLKDSKGNSLIFQ